MGAVRPQRDQRAAQEPRLLAEAGMPGPWLESGQSPSVSVRDASLADSRFFPEGIPAWHICVSGVGEGLFFMVYFFI